MSPFELDDYMPGSSIHLPGYTSTSESKDVAVNFAFKHLQEDMVPVLFEINFKAKSGLFVINEDFSAYPDEGEVLLQDGLKYKVLTNDEMETADTNEKFYII